MERQAILNDLFGRGAFEIEDLHVKEIQKSKDAATKLKAKVLTYLEDVKCEVLCCPAVLRRLMTS